MFNPSNSRRGWHGHSFFLNFGLSVVAKTPPTTGHRKCQLWLGVTVRKAYFLHFFYERGDCWYSKQCLNLKRLTQTFEQLICMWNSMCSIKQKLDPALKPSKNKKLRKIHIFSGEKSNCPRRFKRWLNVCTHVLQFHLEIWPPRVLVLFFSPNVFGST